LSERSRGRSRDKSSFEDWMPKTRLGKMVMEGRVTSIHELFREGYKIKEVEIVDFLVPELKDEVIDINLVQKQTDAGERSRFQAIVAVGNGEGLIGLGIGKARRVRNAIEKGIREGSFYKLLEKDIEEGRGYYLERVPPEIREGTDYLSYYLEEFVSSKRKELGIGEA